MVYPRPDCRVCHIHFVLVGFDDFDIADLVNPPGDGYRPGRRGPGASGREQLLARLAGDVGPTVAEVLPTRLIVRRSGEMKL